jgi:hypothetical protein
MNKKLINIGDLVIITYPAFKGMYGIIIEIDKNFAFDYLVLCSNGSTIWFGSHEFNKAAETNE